MTPYEVADQQRILRGTPTAEVPVAVLARNLVTKIGSVIFDVQAIADGNAAALATVQAFLGIGSSGIGGSTGSTDNAVLRANGTGGATAQSSLVAIDDSGNITAVGINDTPISGSTGAFTGPVELSVVNSWDGSGPNPGTKSNVLSIQHTLAASSSAVRFLSCPSQLSGAETGAVGWGNGPNAWDDGGFFLDHTLYIGTGIVNADGSVPTDIAPQYNVFYQSGNIGDGFHDSHRLRLERNFDVTFPHFTDNTLDHFRLLAGGGAILTNRSSANNALTTTSDNNTGAQVRFKNTKATGDGDTSIHLYAHNGATVSVIGFFGCTNSTYSYSDYGANTAFFGSAGAGGLKLFADNASGTISLYTGGTGSANKSAVFDGTGLVIRKGTANQTLSIGAASGTGGGVLVLHQSASAPTPSSEDAMFYSLSGEGYAMDGAGNQALLTPHATDAPPELYDEGKGGQELSRKVNVFLGVVKWSVPGRMEALLENLLDLLTGTAGEVTTMKADVKQLRASGKLKFKKTETFVEYSARTGKSLVPAGQDEEWWMTHTPAERWQKVEADRAAKSQEAIDAWKTRKKVANTANVSWEAAKNEFKPTKETPQFTDPQPTFSEYQPELYVAAPAPDFLK